MPLYIASTNYTEVSFMRYGSANICKTKMF